MSIALQDVSENILIAIFYQYDIDLKDDNDLDFGDLLDNMLVLVY